MSVIDTKRLRLRQFTHGDAAFILDLLNQPGWKRYIGDRGVNSIDDAHSYIETALIGSYRRHGFGLLAADLKADQLPVGMCGLLKRDALNDVDIGFAFLPQFEGQGLAYEAASAMLAYSAEVLGLRRVAAIVSMHNERSIRLLRRLGMHDEGLVRLSADGEDLRLYAIALRRH